MYLLSMEQSFTGLIDAGVRLTKERESMFIIVVVWGEEEYLFARKHPT